ncbi:MAG: four helix bundle protein [Acidobacteria bacterium]|nr:four helix bundle protein [Acidobacteriota bacterium]
MTFQVVLEPGEDGWIVVECPALPGCRGSITEDYRASCRAKSQADFIAKMGIVEEEADETIYWMELLVESDLTRKDRVADLLDEANQLVAIVVSSIKTARENKR